MILDDMRAHATKLSERAAGYRITGDNTTARMIERAALSMRHAILAVEDAKEAEEDTAAKEGLFSTAR